MHAGDSRIWVLDHTIDSSTFERLGDGRTAADRLGCKLGVLVIGQCHEQVEPLIHHGADHVVVCTVDHAGPATCLAAAHAFLSRQSARLIFIRGDSDGRAWASRLATRARWKLISPALMVQATAKSLDVLMLDRTEQFCRRVSIDGDETAVVTLKPGVGEAMPADTSRHGEVTRISFASEREAVEIERMIPADPRVTDIRYAPRLVAGGRGLGGREGFEVLRAFADKLHAGVAASRMAVDLGWIEHERQVGQTGRTVSPQLYVACGISGASHHLEGMSDAKHIVAINTDPQAPIFKVAHLALVADLYDVIRKTTEAIEKT